jgi:lipoyl(octanoyl) transferase
MPAATRESTGPNRRGPSGRGSLGWAYLGRLGYQAATRLQEEARRELRDGTSGDHLFLLEHPHIYTLGRSARSSDVLAPPAWLRENGVEVFETDRGGQVTYHGPGQLVGYPVMDLDPDRRDVRRYVADLQRVLVEALGELGIAATGERRQSLIGVWVGQRKIASIGVHLSRWITTHGFALNVSTDLDYFRRIVPCGLPDVEMTSIEAITGSSPELPRVAELVARHFGRVFERRLEPADEEALRALAGLGAGPRSEAVEPGFDASESIVAEAP